MSPPQNEESKDKYLCPYCNRDFGNRGGFTNHIRSAHQPEYEAQILMENRLFEMRIHYLTEEIELMQQGKGRDPRFQEALVKYAKKQKKEKVEAPELGMIELDDDIYNDENWPNFEYKNYLVFAIEQCQNRSEEIKQASINKGVDAEKVLNNIISTYAIDKKSVRFQGFSHITKQWFIGMLQGSIGGLNARIEENKERYRKSAGDTCPYCNQYFPKYSLLTEHKEVEHTDEFIKERKIEHEDLIRRVLEQEEEDRIRFKEEDNKFHSEESYDDMDEEIEREMEKREKEQEEKNRAIREKERRDFVNYCNLGFEGYALYLKYYVFADKGTLSQHEQEFTNTLGRLKEINLKLKEIETNGFDVPRYYRVNDQFKDMSHLWRKEESMIGYLKGIDKKSAAKKKKDENRF